VPLPAEELASMSEAERARFARGYAPLGAPAYFYPI
jgi:hypothetical protein